MRYHYDNSAGNSRNPNHPPRRVTAGDEATSEMGHLWLQVVPRGPGDRRKELEQAWLQRRLEKYPDDFVTHLDLGTLMLSRLEAQPAVKILETAVRLQPGSGQAHNMLGAAFSQVGRSREALDEFRSAVQLEPDNVNARFNLVSALVKCGQIAEATVNLRIVISSFPNDARLRNVSGELLLQQDQRAEAAEEFEKAIAIDPTYQAALKNRERIAFPSITH